MLRTWVRKYIGAKLIPRERQHDAVSSEIRQRPERRKRLQRFWLLTRDRENCGRIKVNRIESEGAGKMEKGSLYLISLIACSSFNLTPFRSSERLSIYR